MSADGSVEPLPQGAPGITPYLVAMLVCERIIIEAGTATKTLVSVFEELVVPSLPDAQMMAVYAKITDAAGSYAFTLEYRHLSSDRRIEQFDLGTAQVVDRLGYFELVTRVRVPIDTVGVYEFRLHANDKVIGRIKFTVYTPG